MKYKLDKNLQEFLEEFNLTEREIAIYLTLLKTGPNTIMNLARETGIKRSTTHNNVEELIKKGLVSQTNYGERRMVIAEEPEKLKFLLDQKKWRVKKLEENLDSVISTISKMVPGTRDNSKVEVKYYEGKDNVQIIYKEAFESKELRSYVNLEAVSRVFPENTQMFLDAQKRNKSLKVWEIVDGTAESKKLAENFVKNSDFKYKIANSSMNLSSIDVLIYDDRVAMINFNENITGTVISNRDYYENSKSIFDLIWSFIKD